MRKITKILTLTLATCVLAACEKEEHVSGGTVNVKGAYVLNEGNMGPNNASISVLDIDSAKIDNEWFKNANNNRMLGDQAQDMVLYDSRLYVTVTESNTLEAIDTATGHSTQVSMGSLKPRSIATHGGKLYISCYNPPCVVRVDTTTLAIEDTCLLGNYRPEGIAIAQGKAFIASSYLASNIYSYDDKVYVVGLDSFKVAATVTVVSNPTPVVQLDNNTVAVGCIGNYGSIAANTVLINATTLGTTTVGIGSTKMAVYNGKLYSYSAPYGGTPSYAIISADGSVSDFPFQPSIGGNPYAIGVNPSNGDIYLANDGNYRVPGDLYCFRPDGTQRFKVEAGRLPSKIIFITD